MSEAYKARDDSKAYFITFTIVHWIELFANENFANIIIDSIRYCQQNKGLELYAYCIMPSHVHLIGRSSDRKINEVIRDIKKYTSVQIIRMIKESNVFIKYLPVFYCESVRRKRNEKYKVWQDGYHPIEMFSKKIFIQKLNYIHNNPVEAGIANNSVEYKYSSARNYAGMDGVLDVIKEY